MANALYDKGREAIAADLDLSAATIKALLVQGGYTPNLATDQHVSDVPSGSITARSSAFTTKSVSLGVFNADNLTFTAVATGPACDYIVIYEDTGSDATSRLVALIDTATGLPVTPNGGDISVAWDTGSNKIFKL